MSRVNQLLAGQRRLILEVWSGPSLLTAFLYTAECHLNLHILKLFENAGSIFPDSGDFCRLLIIFANSLDPNVGPELDPNCLTPWWYSWKIIFWNNNLKKKIRQNNMQNFPACKELIFTAPILRLYLTLSLSQAIIKGFCKQHRFRWDGSLSLLIWIYAVWHSVFQLQM